MRNKQPNHVLIALESNAYCRRVLLRGRAMAQNLDSTFEVVFYYPLNEEHPLIALLNIYESSNLSRRLGATTYKIKITKSQRSTTKNIVAYARRQKINEIVIARDSNSHNSAYPWFNKLNFLLRRLPSITVINGLRFNPFFEDRYEKGVQAYIVRCHQKDNPEVVQYRLRYNPVCKNSYEGLFFRKKHLDDHGIFAFVSRDRIIYLRINDNKVTGTVKQQKRKSYLQENQTN